jgi:hypothetical protein
MTLKGWHKPVSKELEQAILNGQVKVVYSEKDKFDYVYGKYIVDEMIKEFQ